jgi:hypothetical protein
MTNNAYNFMIPKENTEGLKMVHYDHNYAKRCLSEKKTGKNDTEMLIVVVTKW